MDIEIYFESTKVSENKYNQYEKSLEEKIKQAKSEIIKKLYEKYSIKIDIKNNCIINSIDGKSRE